MNKEEYYKRLEKTTEKIKTDRCSEDEIANINRQKLYLAEHYISSLEQENEKLHHYKTLYQSLKGQKEELRNYLTKEISDARSEDNLWLMGVYDEDKNILEKMEELEQPKKELLKPSHYDEDIDVEYELEKARKFIQEDKKRKFGKE